MKALLPTVKLRAHEQGRAEGDGCGLSRAWCTMLAWRVVAVWILAGVWMGDVAVPGAEPESKLEREPRMVYVPFEELEDLLARDVNRMLLPKAEYDELRAKARAMSDVADAPAPAVYGPATYLAKVEGSILQIELTAELQQLHDGWQTWDLPLGRWWIEAAKLNDRPALLGRREDGVLQLLTQGRKTHRLVVVANTELMQAGSDRLAAFGVLPGAANRLRMTVPAGKTLELAPQPAPRPTAIGEPADYAVPVVGGQMLQLRLTDGRAQQGADALFLASTAYGVRVETGQALWQAVTQLQVFGRPLDRLMCEVPKTLEITDVDAVGLQAWELLESPDDPELTRISLVFGQAFEGARTLRLRGVRTTPLGEAWTVPTLVIRDVAAHTGLVLVRHAPALRVRVAELEGVRRATLGGQEGGLGDVMATDLAMRFDAWREEFAISLMTQAKDRELRVAVAAMLNVAPTQIRLDAQLRLDVRHAPLFEFDLLLPAGWDVRTATLEHCPATWQTVPDVAGRQRVRFLLQTPIGRDHGDALNLSAVYVATGVSLEEQPLTFAVPELVLPQASLVETTIGIDADEWVEVVATDLEGLDLVSDGAAAGRLRLQSQNARYGAKVRLTGTQGQLRATTTTQVLLRRPTFVVNWLAQLNTAGRPARTLKVQTPERLGTNLQFVGEGGQPLEQQTGDEADGWRTWLLRVPAANARMIALTTEQPRSVTEPWWEVPEIRVVDAALQDGVVLIEAEDDQQLTVTTEGAGGQPLTELDSAEVQSTPLVRAVSRLAGAYRVVQPGWQVRVSDERYAKTALPVAVCPQMHVRALLSRHGETQREAVFRVVATGVQSLEIVMPEGMELWSALLDDTPVELRRRGNAYLAALGAADEDGSTRGTLKLFYRSKEAAQQGWSTHVERFPELRVVTGEGRVTRVDVLDRHVELAYPAGTRLVASEGVFRAAGALDAAGWLAEQFSPADGRRALHLWARGLMLLGVWLFAVAFAWLWRACTSAGTTRGLVWCGGVALVMMMLGGLLTQPGGCSSGPARVNLASTQGVAPALPKPRAALERQDKFMEAPNSIVDFGNDRTELFAKDDVADRKRKERDDTLGTLGDRPMDVENGSVNGRRLANSLTRTAKGQLSLAVAWEPFAGARKAAFRYAGLGHQEQSPALTVWLKDGRAGEAWTWLTAAVCAVLAWWGRQRTWRTVARGGVTLALLAVGLAPVVPATWQPVVDGLLLGAVAWVAIPLLARVMECTLVTWTRWRMRMGQWLAWGLVGLVWCCGDAVATEPKAAPALEPYVTVPMLTGQTPETADRVLLPMAMYRKLLEHAEPDRKPVAPAPLAGGVAEAHYRAEVLAEQVRVRARFAVMSYVDGWQTFALPLGAVALEGSRVAGATSAEWPADDGLAAAPGTGNAGAPLTFKDGRWHVALPAPGWHVIDLTFLVPLTQQGAAGHFSIPVLPLPAARLTAVLPAGEWQVRVNGSTMVYKQRDAATIELAVDQAQGVTVAWQLKTGNSSTAAVLHVESAAALAVQEAGLALSAAYQYRVRQGAVSDVSLTIPPEWRLQSIVGPDVGGWELAAGTGERALKVLFRRPVSDETKFTLEFFAPRAWDTTESQWGLKTPVPREVTHETGVVGVFVGDGLTTRALSQERLTQTDVGQYQPQLPLTRPAGAPLLAYRFAGRPWGLELQVGRTASRAAVQAQHAVLIDLRKQVVSSRLRYELSGQPQAGLAIDLPPDYLPLQVEGPGVADWFAAEQEGRLRLWVEFVTPVTGVVELALQGSVAADPLVSGATIRLPEPVGMARAESTLGLWLNRAWTATLGDATGWMALDAGQLPAELRAIQPQRPSFGFRRQDVGAPAIRMQVRRATPRLRAAALTTVTVSEVTLGYALALQWQIQDAATDVLAMSVPLELGGKLQFSATGLRDQQWRAEGERAIYTLTLREPMQGKYFATATVDLPPAHAEVVVPAVRFETGTLAGLTAAAVLEHDEQYVLVLNASLSQMTNATPEVAEAVTAEELPMLAPEELVRQGVELLRLKTVGTVPRWTLQKFVGAGMAAAAVNLADVTLVVERDGTYRGRMELTLKNLSRQFAGLHVPEGVELASVYVAGRAARTVLARENGRELQLVPLPRQSAADLAMRVVLGFTGRLPDVGEALWAREVTAIPIPDVLTTTASTAYGIPTARTRWTVYLPEDWSVSPARAIETHNLSMEDDGGAELQALLMQSRELIAVMESTNSAVLRGMACSNLRQLEGSLQSYGQRSGSSDYDRASELLLSNTPLEPERQRLLSEIARVTSAAEEKQQSRAIQELAVEQQFGLNKENSLQFYHLNTFGSKVADDGVPSNIQNFRFAMPQATPELKSQLALPHEEKAVAVRSARDQYQQFNNEALGRLSRRGRSVEGSPTQVPAKAQAASGPVPAEMPAPAAPYVFGGAKNQTLHDQADGLAVGGDRLGGMAGGGPGGGGGGEHFFNDNKLHAMDADDYVVGQAKGRAGLSLPFELTPRGQKLVFSKVGGEARLGLHVASWSQQRWGMLAAWSAIVMVVAALLWLAPRGVRWPQRLLWVVAVALVFLAPGLELAALGLMATGAVTMWMAGSTRER